MKTLIVSIILSSASVAQAATTTSTSSIRSSVVAKSDPSVGIYTRISSLVPGAEGFDLVSNIGALVRFEAGVEYAPLSPVEGFAIEAGVAAGAQTRRAFQAYDTLLGVTSVQVSGVFRLPIWRYFGAFGRVTGSVDWGHLSIREGVQGTELDDVAVGFSGAGALGAQFAVPLGYTRSKTLARADQWLRFSVEAGYAVHTAMAFDDVRRDVDEDTDPRRVARVAVDAGSLRLSGVVWRLGAAFDF